MAFKLKIFAINEAFYSNDMIKHAFLHEFLSDQKKKKQVFFLIKKKHEYYIGLLEGFNQIFRQTVI